MEGERRGKDGPEWRNNEELRTQASLEHMACAGEQLGWADSLGPYFENLEFLVEGFVIYPVSNGTLRELDAILLLSLSLKGLLHRTPCLGSLVTLGAACLGCGFDSLQLQQTPRAPSLPSCPSKGA